MAEVSIYLNFDGKTEEAFMFYRSVFGGEFSNNGIMRFGDMPPMDGMPPVSEGLKNMVMHVELKIIGGFRLQGTDAPKEMGFNLIFGNSNYISLDLDSKIETDELFSKLSEGGSISQPLMDMFWGAYFGSCTDKFGVQWMFNCNNV